MARKKTPKKTKLIQSLKAANRQLKQEIADRLRVEEALRASSELLQTLINAIPDLVCFKDSQGRWLEANQAVLDLLQLNKIDYRGKTDAEIFDIIKHVNALSCYQEILLNSQCKDEKAWQLQKVYQEEEKIRQNDGILRIYDVMKVPLFTATGVRKGLVILGRDITAKKQAEADYIRLASMVESSEDAIIGNTLDGIIISWNEGAKQIYGYSASQAIGSPISMLALPERPNEMPRILTSITAEGGIDHYETIHVRQDGANIDVSLTISPIKDALGQITGISMIARDISYRKRIECTLEQLRHQNELILDSAGEGICGLNQDGKITFINPAGARMTGYDIRELIMSDLRQITKGHCRSQTPGEPHPDSLQPSPIFATLEDGKVRHVIDGVFWRKDGTILPVEYVSTPMRQEGAIIGAVITFKDITERQAMEKMKDEFISVVSHELRTPLTSIRGSLGLLSSGLLASSPEKSQRMLDIAMFNCDRLMRLVNDILDLERMHSGQLPMHKDWVNLADLMIQAADEMLPVAEKAGVDLCVIPLEFKVMVDRDRIIQMLTNLLSNSIRFSGANKRIDFTAKPQENDVLISVRDRGRGIPPDKIETIFGRFQQVDASDSRQNGGTGLGLAICRSIVQQHGGKIWAESIFGDGSTFFVSLPIDS
ncbi:MULTISPECIES: PAS domain-containing sensor histidine kinase [Limnospira]|uniref:histidine kinase n=1 Tax=Limnospira indica PCC 8005 TaxID=376219 RepID=A0A9P1KKB8_9CYAN|nr:PAS domain S-box protein [Limnospira indica]CDM98018.1 putative two-component sensor histidine kinase [Limnospira indica PCC 8005]